MLTNYFQSHDRLDIPIGFPIDYRYRNFISNPGNWFQGWIRIHLTVADLPVPFRACLNFRYFNSLQSECFPACFHSDVNMVVSAPIGSGKTVIFELCILRHLSRFISQDGRFTPTNGTLKTIYIAPSKALVQEKVRDWTQKFGSRGVVCLELTGDNESYNTRSLQEADIILTTPEKFDAVTRYRVKDGGLGFFSDIALLLIDEVHLLNDPRGAVLETIVSRIKLFAHNPEINEVKRSGSCSFSSCVCHHSKYLGPW